MGKPSKERQLLDTEAKASLSPLRISPSKLNLVADLIRGLDVSDALVQLTYSNKRISREVKKLLQSAIANAENNHNLDIDRLYVSNVNVGKSIRMKRYRPRARGRVGKLIKPFSNISITVREKEEVA